MRRGAENLQRLHCRLRHSGAPCTGRSLDAHPHANGGRPTLALSGDDTGSGCRELSLRFAGAGHAILQMTTAKASLEDIFIELTDGEKEAGKA